MSFLTSIFRWNSSKYDGNEEEEAQRETTFRARVDLDLEKNTPGGVQWQVGAGGDHDGAPPAAAAFVVAVASVDQAWGSGLVKGWPDVGPQVPNAIYHA